MAKDTKVITGEARMSYAHLLEPYAFEEGQTPKYSVTILVPKTDKQTIAKVKAAQDAAIEQGKTSKWHGKVPSNLRRCIKDGDEMDQPECAGMWVIRASSKNRPGIVDGDLNPIIDPTEIYSGCWGRFSITLFPYSAVGNNGISAGLNNVQKTRDDESLGGFSRPEDDFGVFGSDDDGLDGMLG